MVYRIRATLIWLVVFPPFWWYHANCVHCVSAVFMVPPTWRKISKTSFSNQGSNQLFKSAFQIKFKSAFQIKFKSAFQIKFKSSYFSGRGRKSNQPSEFNSRFKSRFKSRVDLNFKSRSKQEVKSTKRRVKSSVLCVINKSCNFFGCLFRSADCRQHFFGLLVSVGRLPARLLLWSSQGQ